jgi:hypothetical protein
MSGCIDWPVEATPDDLRNAILLGIELGLVEGNPTLELLRRKLGALLRVEGPAAVPGHQRNNV